MMMKKNGNAFRTQSGAVAITHSNGEKSSYNMSPQNEAHPLKRDYILHSGVVRSKKSS